MKKILTVIVTLYAITVDTAPAWACTTHNYFVNGRFVTCTTCGQTTTCF